MNAHTPPQPQTPERALRCALVGMPGAGKSTVGRQLAQRMGVPFVDLDHHLEKQLGCSIRQFFEAEGEERFRTLESEALADIAQRPGGMVLSTGGGAVLRPENGGGRAVAALAGAAEAIGLVVLPSALAQIEGGELRALAMTRPSPLLPDVPGFAAAGLAAVDAEAFWGVIAPAATPATLIERLNALLVRPVTEAAVTARLQRVGYVAAATSASEFGAEIRRGIARWQTLAGRPG